MSATDAGIFDHCRVQRGLITLEQLHRLGVSGDQVYWRVRTGRLIRANTNVFRHPVVEPGWEQRVLAAALAAGPSALVARRSAARLWGLSSVRTNRVEVVVPRWNRRAHVEGQLIESTDLRSIDVAQVDGIPVTAVPRTLIDCAAKVGLHRLRDMADDAVHHRLVT